MNPEFTLNDAQQLLEFIGLSERTEHEGYYAELERLDFTSEEQARTAIRKWLVPIFENHWAKTDAGYIRVRTSFEVALSRWGVVPGAPDLPGIAEDGPPYRPLKETISAERAFYAWVWDELFREPLPLPDRRDHLLERVDQDFLNFPDDPARWTNAKYRAIDFWDSMVNLGNSQSP